MSWLGRGSMARWLGVAAAAVLVAFAPADCEVSHTGLLRLAEGQCKAGPPLAGVYLPSRLTVKKSCVTVTGIVDCLKLEPDGDIHIKLRLNGRYVRLLTGANAVQTCPGHTGPHMVVEIIPQDGHLPFPDNSADLGKFVTPAAPTVGESITVTGPLVWDTNLLHDLIYPGRNVKDWAEIHPAWNVTVNR